MKYSKVLAIEFVGNRKTYDIEMPEPNNYVANNMVVHNSGQTMMYTNRKIGKEEVKYEHPLLQELTNDTRGIILYQEQIMQIMHRVGGMSWATAEMARKVITKSKGKKAFEEMRAEFVRNANKLHNMPTSDAEKLYDVVSTFGSYSFNKAHAVEYSIISFWCAYYKVYHPLEFYKAILKHESDEQQIGNYLQDAQNKGIVVEYPNINKSKFEYSIDNGIIYSGFNSIKGIGKSGAKKIEKGQPYVSFEDFLKRCKIGESVLKLMVIADCFREFGINKKVCSEQKITQVNNYYDKLSPDYDDLQHAQLILEFTTLRPRLDVLKMFDFGNYNYADICNLSSQKYADKMGFVRGLVTNILNKDKLILAPIREHAMKFENHMYYLNINDGTGNLAVQINPWTYDKYKDFINNLDKKPIIAYGKFSKDGQKMYCELLQVVGETYDVDNFAKLKSGKHEYITSAVPAVSKNKNSYYRIQTSKGVEGLCFKFSKKLYPGMLVESRINTAPFVELKLLEE